MTLPDQELLSALAGLATERRDPALADLDTLTIVERCALQNRMDAEVAAAVGQENERIAHAVEIIADCLRAGGRLIYIGAGTSGRLGVLDASECPPTFGTPPSLVQGIIAGGPQALTRSIEGAEDDPAAGASAIDDASVGKNDAVVGITASGRTPYVLGALRRAKELGAATVGVTNNRPSELETVAGLTIAAVVGPEFVAGSTRLKSGTAQKLILNMLTTQTMVEIGKTYGNAMVDVMATNAKLIARAHNLVREITGAGDNDVADALEQAGGSAKLAILMLSRNLSADDARITLTQSHGSLRRALAAA